MSKGHVERVIELKEAHPDACVISPVLVVNASVSGFLDDVYDLGQRTLLLPNKGCGVFVWVKLPRGKTLRLHLTEEPDDE